MKQKFMNNVLQGMLPFLNNAQSAQLQKVLEHETAKIEITEHEHEPTEAKNENAEFTSADADPLP